MFKIVPLGGTGVALGTALDPFTLDEVYEVMAEIGLRRRPGLWLDMPQIVDLRGVYATMPKATDIGNYMMRRRALGDAPVTNPIAFVGDRLDTQSTARIFNTLCALSGLRPEDRTEVCDTPDGAAAWMAGRLAPDGPTEAEILEALTHTGEAGIIAQQTPHADQGTG